MTSRPSFNTYPSQHPELQPYFHAQVNLQPCTTTRPHLQNGQRQRNRNSVRSPSSLPSQHQTNTHYREFNELVNMTASDLETWLKSEDSTSAGWSKDDGSETIGHERFVSSLPILSLFNSSNLFLCFFFSAVGRSLRFKKNPERDP
jgi:hypothetical protein